MTRFATFIAAMLFFSLAQAQRLADNRPLSCRKQYVATATVLPQLYRAKDYDSLQRWLAFEEKACGRSPERFSASILLAIETGRFSERDLPDTGFYALLRTYAWVVRDVNGHARYIGYMSNKYFNATPYNRAIFSCTHDWAQRLLPSTALDSTERFLCQVFAGQVEDPLRMIRSGLSTWHYLDSLRLRSLHIRRNMPAGTFGLLSGIWLPTGKLRMMGVHPELGLQMGGRDKTNELDLSLFFRFIHAPQPYLVSRNDSLYPRQHYEGYYIGIEYAHYFIHQDTFESGFTAGSGYDGFAIAAVKKNEKDLNYLKPFSIGSFNVNLGLRANYFFSPELFAGFAAKYHFIHYINRGGTDLDGHALSLSVSIGSNF